MLQLLSIEQTSRIFLNSPSEENGIKLLQLLRLKSFHHTTILFGGFLESIYPYNMEIRKEMAESYFSIKNYRKSYDLYSKNLSKSILSHQEYLHHISKRCLLIDHIADDYIKYNPDIVKSICNKKQRSIPLVTFTITTCKRFDLFEKTMNSFLQCCLDLHKIDYWLCVDDNSSEEDRKKMQELYPFFTFYFKTLQEKGHPRSMNILREQVQTEYIFHIEDDWKFFHPRMYVSDCMDVLSSDPRIKQCLINKNYSEIAKDSDIIGGFMKSTKQGTRHFVHEYAPDYESRVKFFGKYGQVKNCAYWPHYSFRPSLFYREIWTLLGPFNEKISHFEMDYSNRYVQNKFVSAFLDGVYSIHIGRLTSQRDKNIPNAYDLNDELQFHDKEKQVGMKIPQDHADKLAQNFFFIPLKDHIGNDCYFYKENVIDAMQRCLNDPDCAGFNTLGFFKTKIDKLQDSVYFSDNDGIYIKNVKQTQLPLLPESGNNVPIEAYVINLDRRPDRFDTFYKRCPIKCTKFPAIDGKLLKPNGQLQRIFEGNDYNMRSGLVGVAMSHILLWIQLLQSKSDKFFIMEDDVTFIPNFCDKISNLFGQIKDVDWDLVYLGHHLYPKYKTNDCYDKDIPPYIEKMNSKVSLTKSMGGMFAYLITKSGARKMLEYINNNGMTNGIDTVQQKAIGDVNTYYCFPHLVYSKCVLPDNKVDSDIQYEYTSLTLPDNVGNQKEYTERLKVNGVYDVSSAVAYVM